MPTAEPTIQMGSNAEITIDGLHRVDNSKMAMAYVKPDVDLSGYTKIILDPVSIVYKKEPRGTGRMRSARRDSDYGLLSAGADIGKIVHVGVDQR
ncbi:MAG: DUF3313 family protein [Gammaproteobacteria bacterium]|nr:MAG: DUF3313 family protein [Gammaproteobacteria bacterium]